MKDEVLLHANKVMNEQMYEFIDALSIIKELVGIDSSQLSTEKLFIKALDTLNENMDICSTGTLINNQGDINLVRTLNKEQIKFEKVLLDSTQRMMNKHYDRLCGKRVPSNQLAFVSTSTTERYICSFVQNKKELLGAFIVVYQNTEQHQQWHNSFLGLFAGIFSHMLTNHQLVSRLNNNVSQHEQKLQKTDLLLNHERRERKQADALIQHLGLHDELTELANRKMLLQCIDKDIESCSYRSMYGALIYLNLDHFKNINHVMGLDVGDQLLKKVANRIKSCVRQNETVARLEGDEFVILLSKLSDNESNACIKAEQVAKKLKDTFLEPFYLGGDDYFLPLNIGATVFPTGNETADKIIKKAYSAMHKAKQKGNKTLLFYQKGMNSEAVNKMELTKELYYALERDQFELYFQPQLNQSKKVIGAEVLIRWNHPKWGLVSPDKFIPVAEETGVIQAIGDWVLTESVNYLKKLEAMKLYRPGFQLAINISPLQFSDINFVEKITYLLNDSKVNPAAMKLEVTESSMLKNVSEVILIMKSIKDMGLSFSIDDFGTGYSSLSQLKNLPADQLKIDRSFIIDIESEKSDMAIVDTIIAMGNYLGFQVLAEGVETEKQFDLLCKMGCRAFQGYYFSRPLPNDKFFDYMQKQLELNAQILET